MPKWGCRRHDCRRGAPAELLNPNSKHQRPGELSRTLACCTSRSRAAPPAGLAWPAAPPHRATQVRSRALHIAITKISPVDCDDPRKHAGIAGTVAKKPAPSMMRAVSRTNSFGAAAPIKLPVVIAPGLTPRLGPKLETFCSSLVDTPRFRSA